MPDRTRENPENPCELSKSVVQSHDHAENTAQDDPDQCLREAINKFRYRLAFANTARMNAIA